MSKDNNKIKEDMKMSQNLTTKEKVVWYGGGGVVITSLSVVLLHSLGYNLGWLSIGLDKLAFQMAKYTTGVEAEQGPIYQVSKDKPIMLEASPIQPVIPSKDHITAINTALVPKRETISPTATNIIGLVTSEEMVPLSFNTPSIEEDKNVPKTVTKPSYSYKPEKPKREPKPVISATKRHAEVKPKTNQPTCHDQIKQNLKLTPWCQNWKNGLTKPSPSEEKTVSLPTSSFKKPATPGKPLVDPRKPYVEKWEAAQEALRQKRLKEWHEAQALKAKRAEYHKKWKENEERKKEASQQAKSNPINLMTPTHNKPPVKKLPSCQEQHKQGLTLSAWCKINWKPPSAAAKVVRPTTVTKPPLKKPVKTKPVLTQADKDKQFCENKLKLGKTTKACIRLGYHKPRKKPAKPKYGKPTKKCSNGVDQLTQAQKLRLSRAGVNVNVDNCDNGWRPPKGAEKYWTGTSECLNPDGSYMIPNFKCDKWKK